MPKPAGYSDTQLIKKLGWKPGMRVRLINEPAQYNKLLGELPEDITFVKTARGECDFIHLFARNNSALDRALPGAMKQLAADGMLWISWPKKTSPITSDLDGNIVRETGLAGGLVDVKVCAVDEDWSGLKFVHRLKDRPKKR